MAITVKNFGGDISGQGRERRSVVSRPFNRVLTGARTHLGRGATCEGTRATFVVAGYPRDGAHEIKRHAAPRVGERSCRASLSFLRSIAELAQNADKPIIHKTPCYRWASLVWAVRTRSRENLACWSRTRNLPTAVPVRSSSVSPDFGCTSVVGCSIEALTDAKPLLGPSLSPVILGNLIGLGLAMRECHRRLRILDVSLELHWMFRQPARVGPCSGPVPGPIMPKLAEIVHAGLGASFLACCTPSPASFCSACGFDPSRGSLCVDSNVEILANFFLVVTTSYGLDSCRSTTSESVWPRSMPRFLPSGDQWKERICSRLKLVI
jgi:hypothetical protein